MIYCKHSIRSLLTSMLRKASIQYPSDVYALSFKKYKGEFLKDKNVLLCTRLYKYAPNLESLLTQQIRSLSGALIMKSTLTIVSASFILHIWHSYIYKVHLYVYIGWCNGHGSSRKTSELYKSLANLTFKEVTDKVDLY
jgi:hypothetical protein